VNQQSQVLNDGVLSMLPYLIAILKANLTTLKMFLQQAYPLAWGFAKLSKSTLETRHRSLLY